MRPLYQRATAAKSLRFTAISMEAGSHFRGGTWLPGSKSYALFDGTGPVRSSLKPLMPTAAFVAAGPATQFWYATNNCQLLTDGGQPGTQPVPISFDPTLAPPSWCAGIAYDPRRQRVMMISQSGAGATAYTYTPRTAAWAVAGTLGRAPGYLSLTFSEHDDCFYALSHAWGPEGEVPAITRISPEGKAEWRIPVLERIGIGPGRDRNWPPQIVAAGPRLAIVTPPLPDADAPEAPHAPRCVVVDPKTYRVEYTGPLAPHDGGAPARRPHGNQDLDRNSASD
jgi:hypothetical protein